MLRIWFDRLTRKFSPDCRISATRSLLVVSPSTMVRLELAAAHLTRNHGLEDSGNQYKGLCRHRHVANTANVLALGGSARGGHTSGRGYSASHHRSAPSDQTTMLTQLRGSSRRTSSRTTYKQLKHGQTRPENDIGTSGIVGATQQYGQVASHRRLVANRGTGLASCARFGE